MEASGAAQLRVRDGDRTVKLADNTVKRSPNRVDLSKSDLVRLLSYLEGELQARDVTIATLKTEKAKQLLYQAKYGRLGLNDPLAALQRDSEQGVGPGEDFDEGQIGKMYESQLAQLEKLISVQRRAHHRAKQVLAAAERRHAKTVRELEQEKQRSVADAEQGDDVCMMLEKEREKLKQEIEYHKSEYEKLEKDLTKARKNLMDEKERHKTMVLYLVNERRQLLVKLQEEKHKINTISKQRKHEQEQASSQESNEKMISELRAQMEQMSRHSDDLAKALEAERQEAASLREIVRTQEEDLNLIRQNILAKTRQMSAQKQSSPSALPTSPTKLPSASKSRPPPAYAPHQRQNSTPVPQRVPEVPQYRLPSARAGVPQQHSAETNPYAQLTEEARTRLTNQYASTGSVHQQRPPTVTAARRPATFNQELRQGPPPPPPYDSPTGYIDQSPSPSTAAAAPLVRQGSARSSKSDKKSPPAKKGNKTEDSRRPRQASDDTAVFMNPYAAELPEIAQLEAVIDSLASGTSTLPPNRNISQPLVVVNGAPSVAKPRSASLPRNGSRVAIPSRLTNGGARVSGLPARLPPGGSKPNTPVMTQRGPMVKAFVGARKEKKATQV